ncbi:extracellular matrix/biofilm biosynthesis regulator RemA family protein [Bacillus spongiae]|uniref:Extracellular matrix/biofilm biosynthesis regulator RemA family protein n=1 Tax=Bacillus spongiae TaxID=2683610 RepID=A0ABU8HGJ8_9BACI
MYIHVGEDVMVRTNEIIAVIDKATVQSSEEMQLFLRKQKNQLQELGKGPYKSLVVTYNGIYLSPLASGTLKKRAVPGNI